jgi:hypothetical protein
MLTKAAKRVISGEPVPVWLIQDFSAQDSTAVGFQIPGRSGRSVKNIFKING